MRLLISDALFFVSSTKYLLFYDKAYIIGDKTEIPLTNNPLIIIFNSYSKSPLMDIGTSSKYIRNVFTCSCIWILSYENFIFASMGP